MTIPDISKKTGLIFVSWFQGFGPCLPDVHASAEDHTGGMQPRGFFTVWMEGEE